MVGLGVLYASWRWEVDTEALVSQLAAGRVSRPLTRYDPQELIPLPAPVQRYFRAVLSEGQPFITAVNLEQTGTFNLSETGAQWKPFTATQQVTLQRPGFVWDARVAMLPGVQGYIHDAYVAGVGLLHVTLYGLVAMVKMRGTPELAQGELMRFFAEAAWYPTALLPSQGVHWEAVDDHSAYATLKDGAITLKMLFRFNAEGLIESVRGERGYTTAGQVVPKPWECRVGTYVVREGMQIPLEGEAIWILPTGPHPYFRGRITTIGFEFTSSP